MPCSTTHCIRWERILTHTACRCVGFADGSGQLHDKLIGRSCQQEFDCRRLRRRNRPYIWQTSFTFRLVRCSTLLCGHSHVCQMSHCPVASRLAFMLGQCCLDSTWPCWTLNSVLGHSVVSGLRNCWDPEWIILQVCSVVADLVANNI